MRNSCNCTRQAARSAVINDFTVTNRAAGDITVLATRIFDGVQRRMDSAPCTVNIQSDIQPASLISAYTTDQRAWAENTYISEYNQRYQLVECDIVCPGQAIFNDAQGTEHSAYCTITIPYSALMMFPEDALLPAFLSCLCSASVISAVQNTSRASSFNAYLSGALAVFTSSYLPVQLSGNGQFYPDDISCRTAFTTSSNNTRPVFTNSQINADDGTRNCPR